MYKGVIEQGHSHHFRRGTEIYIYIYIYISGGHKLIF